MSSGKRMTVIMLVLLGLIAPIYLPLTSYDFTNYDDSRFVPNNEMVNAGLTLDGAKWALGDTKIAFWRPVTWLSHMADVELFGLWPGGHHLTNVVLHILNAWLLAVALLLLTGNAFGGLVVAAVFAAHPINVETVAWISERKEVLAAFFFMITVIGYYRYLQRPRLSRYALLTAVYACGLMSKVTLVPLPLVLLALDYWPLGRWPNGSLDRDARRAAAWKPVVEKIPLAALSILTGMIVFVTERNIGGIATVAQLPVTRRIILVPFFYAVYWSRFLLPRRLMVHYLFPTDISVPLVIISFMAVAAITYLVLRKKDLPYLFMGWLWYLVLLVPMIGLVQVGSTAAADHYVYLPLIGLLVGLTWSLDGILDTAAARRCGLISLLLVVAALAFLSSRQARVWRDSGSLFGHALRIEPNDPVSLTNYGAYLASKGREVEAKVFFKRALAAAPDHPDAFYNLGVSAMRSGDDVAAIEYFRKARLRKSDDFMAGFNLGLLLARSGDRYGAVESFRASAAGAPMNPGALAGIALELINLGDFAAALGVADEALRVKPGHAEANYAKGAVLERQGLISEAVRHYRRALIIQPGHHEARSGLERLEK